ncbi:SIR2 family protein [Photobacterium leiognathi]|uniref:SIR2 family protein n=1 Tax=Photobacterium leiognathi TaxID=553611 RepID=UPI002981672A|nr:SIR2 family protein [Photobacterium leiognathi]
MTDLLKTLPPVPDEIIEAAKDGRLVLFVGAGASMMVGMPSWGGLAGAALNSLVENGCINYSELEQLKKLDPKKQLSIADFISQEKGTPLDLRQHLKARWSSSIYPNINSIKATCVTTNYDHELSPQPLEDASEKETKASVVRKSGVENLQAADLKVPGTVIHLHGDMDNPDTMIVTTRDYLAHYDEIKVQHFLSELFRDFVVVFIGYGLEETEILEHILRRSGVKDNDNERQRFLLQPFFKNEQSLYERLKVYHQKSFGVHLIGYARDEKDYRQLEDVIEQWALKLNVRPPSLVDDIDMMDRILNDE